MRILLLADNKPGLFVSRFLVEHNENVIGLCLHEEKYRNNGDEIVKSLNLGKKYIFEVIDMKDDETFDFIQSLKPDLILSIYWRYMLPERIIQLPEQGCINYHPAMLPYNRGKNPNVWPIIENTPAGVSLHYIDTGIDTGDIIAQKEVKVEPTDTGETLYNKLKNVFEILFSEIWPTIKKNNVMTIKQKKKKGTFHTSKQFQELGEIDLYENFRAVDLINLLRAKTFSGKPAAYYVKEGKKIYLRIHPSYE